MNNEPPNKDVSRRDLAAALSVFGGAIGLAALASCADDGGSSEEPPEPSGRDRGGSLAKRDCVVDQSRRTTRRDGRSRRRQALAAGRWRWCSATLRRATGAVVFSSIGRAHRPGAGTAGQFSQVGIDGGSSVGRWKRVYSGALNVRWFEAPPNVTDAAIPLNAMLKAVLVGNTGATDQPAIYVPAGTYTLKSTVAPPNSASFFEHRGTVPGPLSFSGPAGMCRPFSLRTPHSSRSAASASEAVCLRLRFSCMVTRARRLEVRGQSGACSRTFSSQPEHKASSTAPRRRPRELMSRASLYAASSRLFPWMDFRLSTQAPAVTASTHVHLVFALEAQSIMSRPLRAQSAEATMHTTSTRAVAVLPFAWGTRRTTLPCSGSSPKEILYCCRRLRRSTSRAA